MRLWAMLPIAIYSFGWALMVPVVTLQLLDLFPERRGMASSLQAVVGSTANGLVAGLVAPLVMHSAIALADRFTGVDAGGAGVVDGAAPALARNWPRKLKTIAACALNTGV